MKKKKIAFVISSLNAGGAERVLSILANELVSYYDITIILLYNDKPFYGLHSGIKIVSCIESYAVNKNIIKSVVNHFRLVKTIYKHLKKIKADVCISFMTTTNVYAILASKFARVPIIVSERIHPKYDDLNANWKRLRSISYPFANVLVVQTEAIKVFFQNIVKPHKICIITNPIAPELLQKKDKSIMKVPIILNVGRLTNQKNQSMLIKAFKNIEAKGWQLQIIGDGINKSIYEALIAELDLKDSVSLLGNSDEIHQYYNKASIFAFPSNYEGFPNALTEAMAFGLPCVSADCPSGPSEVINDGDNGFLIPVNDQKALEAKLQMLVNDESLRKTMGQKAQLCSQDFESKAIASQWQLIINQILSNHETR